MYESIVKGECSLEPGLPESFKVLIKELQSLCLDVDLIEEKEQEEEEVDEASRARDAAEALFSKRISLEIPDSVFEEDEKAEAEDLEDEEDSEDEDL